jgi:hypothetical protein
MSLLRPLLLSTALVACAAQASALDVHVDLYGGVFQGSSDTEPVDKRTEVGAMADLTLDILPFGFCANVLYNKDDVDGADEGLEEVATTELQLGLFKQFDVPVIHPFIGGGVALLNTSIEAADEADEDESTIGAWAYVGARMTILFIDFGVVGGYTWAEAEVDGDDVDVGGWRVGGFVGVGF